MAAPIKDVFFRLVDRMLNTSSGRRRFYSVASALVASPVLPDSISGDEVESAMRGQANRHVVTLHPDWAWPYWVHVQRDPALATYFSLPAIYPYINVSYRHWTTLGVAGSKEKIQVDPKGLITPFRNGWSLDFWVRHNQTLYTPATTQEVTQRFSAATNSLSTVMPIGDIRVESEVFYKAYQRNEHLIHNAVTLENTGDKSVNLVFYLAIRPFNVEGLSSVASMAYLSQDAVVINDKLSLIADETPSNVVFSSAATGDVSQCLDMEMVLQSKCPSQLGSGFLAYSLSMKPGSKRTLTFKSPIQSGPYLKRLFDERLRPQFRSLLTARINTLKEFDYANEKKQAAQYWKDQVMPMAHMQLPNSQLNQLFLDGQNHLQALINLDRIKDPSLFHGLNALLLSGAGEFVLSIIKEIPLYKRGFIPSSSIAYVAQGIVFFEKLQRFYPDRNRLEAFYPRLFKLGLHLHKQIYTSKKAGTWVSGLPKARPIFETHGPIDQVLSDAYWMLSAFRSLIQLSEPLKKVKEKARFVQFSHDLSLALEQYLKHIQDRDGRDYLPAGVTMPFRNGLIFSLRSALLGFHKSKAACILEGVEKIESHFMHDNMICIDSNTPGLSPYATALLARLYLQQKNPRCFTLLNRLIECSGPTHSFADAYHPQSGYACGGDGHSLVATAEVSLLLRNMMLEEDGDSIVLLPFLPESWFTQAEFSCGVERMPTSFGQIGFTFQKSGQEIRITLTTNYHLQPLSIKLTLPTRIVSIEIDGGKEKKVNGFTATIPSPSKAVRLVLSAL